MKIAASVGRASRSPGYDTRNYANSLKLTAQGENDPFLNAALYRIFCAQLTNPEIEKAREAIMAVAEQCKTNHHNHHSHYNKK